MTNNTDVDYGPLTGLIGLWRGNNGHDRAPDPDQPEENNAFCDEIRFVEAGRSTNAEQQELVALRYHHIVRKQDGGAIFHDQIGHWLYEPKTGLIMHSLSIPRGVTLLAGGKLEQENQQFIFKVDANTESNDFGIAQSPFMLDNAKTTAFTMRMCLDGDTLSYKQTTTVDIYGGKFEHTDQSELQRDIYD